MISSTFRRARDRPVANAAYTVGLYLGAGLASLSTLVALRHGWRSLFWLVGCVGIVVAVVFEVTVDLRWTCFRWPSVAVPVASSSTSVQEGLRGDYSEAFFVPPPASGWRHERVPLLSGAAGGEEGPAAPGARKITVTNSHTGPGTSRSIEASHDAHSPTRGHGSTAPATGRAPPSQTQAATPTAAAVGRAGDVWGDRGMARYDGAATAGRDADTDTEDGGLVLNASEDR